MNWLSKLGYGGTATVIGLIIVFTGLTIIIFSLKIMAAVFKAVEKRKAAKITAAAPKAEVSAPDETAVPAAEEAVEEVIEEDESELIAVIAAAIAAFDFGSGSKPVRIKSVKRVSGWKNAARTEQIYKF